MSDSYARIRSAMLPETLGRRRFLEGLAGGGVMLGASSRWHSAFAQMPATATGTPPMLSGTEFDLTIAETPVNYTGAARMAVTINGSLPGRAEPG